MAANAAFTSETLAVAKPGETLSVGPWLVQLEGVDADRGQELDRDRGRAARDARRRAGHAQAADPLFHRPADRDQRSGDRHLLERPALHRVGKPDAAGGWQLRLWWKPFVTLIWARRRADRAGRRAGAARAAVAAAPAPAEPSGAGALRMSRAVRFAPLALLLLLIAGAGLAAGDARRHERQLEARGQAGAGLRACRPRCRASRACRRAISRPAEPRLVNIFASWCVPCITEVKVLAAAQAPAASPIDGIAVRDRPEDIADFLAAQWRPVRADRQRRAKPGADRARLVGRAGELHRRWPGHHPLPAYRPDRADGCADDPARSWSRRNEACSSCCARDPRRAAAARRQQFAAGLLGQPPAARRPAGSARRRR